MCDYIHLYLFKKQFKRLHNSQRLTLDGATTDVQIFFLSENTTEHAIFFKSDQPSNGQGNFFNGVQWKMKIKMSI